MADAAVRSPELVAEGETDGRLLESSDAREDAALDSTLENSEASELEAAVLVATTLASSELREDARLERALEAASVTVAGTLVDELAMLDASDSTDEPADETALEASEAAEETRAGTMSVLVAEACTKVVAVPVPNADSVASPKPVAEVSPADVTAVLDPTTAELGTVYVPAVPVSVIEPELSATAVDNGDVLSPELVAEASEADDATGPVSLVARIGTMTTPELPEDVE